MISGLLGRVRGGGVSRGKVIFLLCGIWACLNLARLTPCLNMSVDIARYLALAQSIAGGRGYTLEGRFCRHYPPLFPFMLSTVVSPDCHDFRPEKFIVALTALGAALGSYWLLSQRYHGRRLLVLTLLVAVSPAFLRYCVRPLSDVPFFLFAMVFMAAANRFWRAEGLDWPMGLTSAAALAAAALTRSAGLVFYPASLLWLARPGLWRRDARRCAAFAAFMAFIALPPALGWMIWVNTHSADGTSSYADVFRTGVLRGESPFSAQGLRLLASTEAKTMPNQLRYAARAVLHAGGRADSAVWAAVLVPVGLLGLARRMRRPDLSDYCFCGYALMILVWPRLEGVRFWVPVLPLMLGYVADGIMGFGHFAQEFPRLVRWGWLRRLDALLGRHSRRVAWWGAALLFAVGIVSGTAMVSESWSRCREAVGGVYLTRDPLDVALFLNAAHERPVVLAYSRFREVAPALTNRNATVVNIRPSESKGLRFLQQMRNRGVTHVAIERRPKGPRGQAERLAAARARMLQATHRFRLVKETEHVHIFQILWPDDM